MSNPSKQQSDLADFLNGCTVTVRRYLASEVAGGRIGLTRIGQAWEIQGRAVDFLVADPRGLSLQDLQIEVNHG